MAYTVINFKTKKALKEAVANWNNYVAMKADAKPGTIAAVLLHKAEASCKLPQPVRCYQPGLGPSLARYTGTVTIEGPHYPEPHRWYASCTLKDGVVMAVR